MRLSPIPFVAENNTWNQTFSSSYASVCEDGYKHSSCIDIDSYKTNSARAPSTDSLNIRTDEKMPAKGEISEQESNGDVEGLWSHPVNHSHNINSISFHFNILKKILPIVHLQYSQQIYTNENDNIPRYTNSYDTTVARESWSLSNEQSIAHETDNMPTTYLMKLYGFFNILINSKISDNLITFKQRINLFNFPMIFMYRVAAH